MHHYFRITGYPASYSIQNAVSPIINADWRFGDPGLRKMVDFLTR
jgi:hypothetical protein